jgi:hypothetical protein
MQRRHRPIAATVAGALALAVLACGSKGPTPPPGELRSALAVQTLAGTAFDPGSLAKDVTMVTFWSPT